STQGSAAVSIRLLSSPGIGEKVCGAASAALPLLCANARPAQTKAKRTARVRFAVNTFLLRNSRATIRGCPILARSVRKGGIPPLHPPWDFDGLPPNRFVDPTAPSRWSAAAPSPPAAPPYPPSTDHPAAVRTALFPWEPGLADSRP